MYSKNRIHCISFFLFQGGASKGVLPVYGKRGDKTQTWIYLDLGIRECLVEVICRMNSNTTEYFYFLFNFKLAWELPC